MANNILFGLHKFLLYTSRFSTKYTTGYSYGIRSKNTHAPIINIARSALNNFDMVVRINEIYGADEEVALHLARSISLTLLHDYYNFADPQISDAISNCLMVNPTPSYFTRGELNARANIRADLTSVHLKTPSRIGYRTRASPPALTLTETVYRLKEEMLLSAEINNMEQFIELGSLLNGHPDWAYWKVWRNAFDQGVPLDWEFQKRVALIPDTYWKNHEAPARVAQQIRAILSSFETSEPALTVPKSDLVESSPDLEVLESCQAVLESAREVEEYILAHRASATEDVTPMMGHNKPPPDEQLPIGTSELERLIVIVQQLQDQFSEQPPPKEILQSTAEQIDVVADKSGTWLAEKLDKSADEFFREFGKQSGRVAVGGLTGIGLWFLGLWQLLQPLRQHLWNLLSVL